MVTPASENAADVIIIGAGHNGLATALVLARHGHKVLVLEKNNYVGGMGATREILPGCRNEVGASCLFPLSAEVQQYFNFAAHGVQFIPLPIMAINHTAGCNRPLLFHRNSLRLALVMCRDFGPGAMLGFARFMRFCQYPASVIDRFTPRRLPQDMQQLINQAETSEQRQQLQLAFSGSAMDIIDKFFPDKVKHKELRANLAFAAVQATCKGPYTPGSGFCLVYTMAQEGSEGMMQRVRGGIGSLSESLTQQLHDMGSEVRLKQNVSEILVNQGRAIGVALKDGSRLYARVVVSNLDKPATFQQLLPAAEVPPAVQQQVAQAEHRSPFVHMLFKLRGLPSYRADLAYLNRMRGGRFGGAMVLDPDEMQSCYEICMRGELPPRLPLAYQFPSLLDATLAPAGYHIASVYGFYFPCEAPKEQRGKLRDQAAQQIVAQITEYMPDFAERIESQAIFSADHFATMHGATNGDWTHGLLHPEQMLAGRSLMADSAHATPISNLYLCGASCHPGPGVTFLPGYNCAHEILAAEVLAGSASGQAA